MTPASALPGQTDFDFWMAGLGSLATGLLGVAVLFRLVARKLGVGAARFGTVCATLGSPLVWYLVTQPLYQHACAFFAVTLLVERWDAWRGAMDRRRWAALGALGGLAMLMRLQEAMWLLLPGLDALFALVAAARAHRLRDLREVALGGALLGAVAALVFAPQLALWHWFFGFIRPPQPPGHMRWLDPALVATIFSTRAGLLPWVPLGYLVAPGLALARRRLDGLAWRLALLFAVELWVNASAWDHWGSYAFGPRRFTDATVVLAFGLAGLWSWLAPRAPRWRYALASIAAAAILGNGVLMESLRAGRTKSSGSAAYPASTWLEWVHGPKLVGKAFDAIGFPFCQPAGWIYALVYKVPVRTFEAVVGNYFLQRDCRIHGALTAGSLDFSDHEQFIVEGVTGPPVGQGAARRRPVGRRVRLLVPLFARESVGLRLTGTFHGGERAVRLTWNGEVLPAKVGRDEVSFQVPEGSVHTRARTNVVVLELPDGVLLKSLDFTSLGNYWR
jgi:hypothetical protein